MAPFKKGQLTCLLRGYPDDNTGIKEVTKLINSCTSREELDDVYDRRTAFMAAARLSKGDDIFPDILDLIWAKYKDLGCGLNDVLNQKLDYGPGNWSVMMNACKCGQPEVLERVYGFYREAFRALSKEDLAKMLQEDHIDLNHVDRKIKKSAYWMSKLLGVDNCEAVSDLSNYATKRRRRSTATAPQSRAATNKKEAKTGIKAASNKKEAKTGIKAASDKKEATTRIKAEKGTERPVSVEKKHAPPPAEAASRAKKQKQMSDATKTQSTLVTEQKCHSLASAQDESPPEDEDPATCCNKQAHKNTNNSDQKPASKPNNVADNAQDVVIVIDSDDEEGKEPDVPVSWQDLAPNDAPSEAVTHNDTSQAIPDRALPEGRAAELSIREMMMDVEDFICLPEKANRKLPYRIERMEKALGRKKDGTLAERLEYLWNNLFVA